jgi:hypothetical protein
MSVAATVLAARLHGTNRKDLSMLPHCTPDDRFWAKVLKTDDCWLWTGALSRRNCGYGRLRFKGRMVAAHRLSWQLTQGQIPRGLHVLHLCDEPQCVNPSHLFLGTQSENNRDMAEKGRARNIYIGASHCKRGHPFDEKNTYHRPSGGRTCRACESARNIGRKR